MVCLDSDILIDFLNNKKDAVNKIIKLRKDNVRLATTAINSFELLNISVLPNKDKIDKIYNFLLNFDIYNFDFDCSGNAAKISQDLKSKGSIIDLPDIMIASVCIENNEPLLTRNVSHFNRISSLKLESI